MSLFLALLSTELTQQFKLAIIRPYIYTNTTTEIYGKIKYYQSVSRKLWNRKQT